MRKRSQIPQNMTPEQAEKRKKDIEKSLAFHKTKLEEASKDFYFINNSRQLGFTSSDYNLSKDLLTYHRGMVEILKKGYLYPGELTNDLIKQYFPYMDLDEEDYTDYVCVCLKTTGKTTDSYITEIGAVKVQDNEIIDTFSSLVRSPIMIPRKATTLTGITIEENVRAPLASEVIPKFLDFIGDSVLIWHNINRYPILKTYCSELGLRLSNSTFDTYKVAREFFPLLKRHRLPDLCAYYGINNDSAHRALSDATANHYVFQALRNGAPGDPNAIPDNLQNTPNDNFPAIGKNVKEFCKALYSALYNGISVDTVGNVLSWFEEHHTLKTRNPYAKIYKSLQLFDLSKSNEAIFELFTSFINENYSSVLTVADAPSSYKNPHNENTEEWKTAVSEFRNLLSSFAKEENIPSEHIHENTLKDESISFSVESNIVARLIPNPTIRIALPVLSILNYDPNLKTEKEKKYPEYGRFDLDLKNPESLPLKILKYILHNYTPNHSFGCCGRYKECSDVRKCVHYDLFYARGCQYKKNLDNGKIFY